MSLGNLHIDDRSQDIHESSPTTNRNEHETKQFRIPDGIACLTGETMSHSPGVQITAIFRACETDSPRFGDSDFDPNPLACFNVSR